MSFSVSGTLISCVTGMGSCSAKGQIVTFSGFVGHVVCIQVLNSCRVKGAETISKQRGAAVLQENLITECDGGSGLAWAFAY